MSPGAITGIQEGASLEDQHEASSEGFTIESLRKLGRGASTIFVANIIYAACQWLVLVILAKMKDPVAVGEFSYVFAVTAPLVLLSGLQLKTVLVTDSSRQLLLSNFIALRLATAAVLMGIVCLIGIISPHDGVSYHSLWLMALAKTIESMSDLLHGVFLRHGKIKLIFASMLARGAFSTLLFSTSLFAFDTVVASVAGLALGNALVLIGIDLPNCLRVTRDIQRVADDGSESVRQPATRSGIWRILLLGLPLGATVALNSATSNIPRYFLEWHLGMYEVGVFSAIAMSLRLGFYLENAVNQAALPGLAHAFATRDRISFVKTIQILLGWCSGLLLLGCAISYFAGEQLLRLAFSSEYSAYYLSLVVLMMAQGLGYLTGVLKTAIDASGSFHVQVPLLAISLLSAFIGALWLVPRYGVMGASMTMLFPRIVMVIGYAAILRNVLRTRFDEGQI